MSGDQHTEAQTRGDPDPSGQRGRRPRVPPLAAVAALALGAAVLLGLRHLLSDRSPRGPAAVVLAEERIQADVEAALSDAPVQYREREAHARKIPDDLGPKSIRLLVEALGRPPSALPGLSEDEWYGLADLLFIALRYQRAAPPGFTTGALLGLWNRADLDPIVRDYALQHLLHFHTNRDPLAPVERDPGRRRMIEETLWAAARGSAEPQHAATAIHLLRDLSVYGEPASRGATQKTVQALAPAGFVEHLLGLASGGSDVPTAVRIAAVQVAAELAPERAVGAARALAADDATPIGLRMAAVAALGIAGGAPERELLGLLRARDHPRLRDAVRGAALRLDRRLATPQPPPPREHPAMPPEPL